MSYIYVRLCIHNTNTLYLYIYTASGSKKGRSSENDREDVDQKVPVSDISTVILY